MAKFTFHPEDFTIRVISGVISFTGNELYSEATDWADEPGNMSYTPPVDANGQFALGGGISSDAIYRILEPWKLKPYDGTYTLTVVGTVITDGGILLDYNGQTVDFNGTAVREYVVGQSSGASGIVSADSTSGDLADGQLTLVDVQGTFTSGENILGDQGGSATVASAPSVTTTQIFIPPDSGSVTISVIAGSSGTVAFSDEVNNQSFLGQVWIDVDAGTPGTTFPKGTPTDPVNNFTDARSIATTRKLNAYHLEATLNLGSSDSAADTDWVGNSPTQSRIVFSGLSTHTNDFRNMTVQGNLSGKGTFTDVHFDSVSGFDGTAHNSSLENLICISDNMSGDSSFIRCHTSPTVASAVVDMCSGVNESVSFAGHVGGLTIRNLHSGSLTLDMVAGDIVLESSCIGGTVLCRGISAITDNSTTGCTVNTDGLVSNTELRKINFFEAVHMDEANGTSGQAYPIGTPASPSNNMVDAMAIAASVGLDSFHIVGSTIVSGSMNNNTIQGAIDLANVGVYASASTSGTHFHKCDLTGTFDGTARVYVTESILNGIQNCHGHFLDSSLGGTVGMIGTAHNLFQSCYSHVPGTGMPILDMNSGVTTQAALRSYAGGIRVQNVDTTASALTLDMLAGNVILDATCTAGNIVIRGTSRLTDNSASGCTVTTEGMTSATYYEEGYATVFGGGDAFTISGFTADTTSFNQAETDHWKDAFVRFVTGTLKGQVKLVTAYSHDGAKGSFTTEAFSSIPADGDKFVVVSA